VFLFVPIVRGCSIRSIYSNAAEFSERLQLRNQGGKNFFGIAKEHAGFFFVKKFVINTRIAGIHGALVHNDVPGVFHFQNRHAVNGRAGIGFGGG